MDTYAFLQDYWWLIISVLAALLVLLLFVQGGQSMLTQHATAAERALLVCSLGRKWELTFTTLVTFGGAFFAAFPLFYSTSFGGAYWLWMLILFSFVVQAISYEYRAKRGNVYGMRFYDTLLLINGVAGPFLLGAFVGSMFFGNEFTVTRSNLLNAGSPVISTWGAWHGLEVLACWKNWLFGLMVLMLARTLASLYFINNIDDEQVQARQHRLLPINGGVFVVLFLAVMAVVLCSGGVTVNESGSAQWTPYVYMHNLLSLWWVLLLLVAGVVPVLWGIACSVLRASWRKGIWPAGVGTVLVVIALFCVLGYNNTAYYPSVLDVQSSLTIRNSSSSPFTLTVMSYVSLLVPFVAAYIAYCWRALDRGKISRNDASEGH